MVAKVLQPTPVEPIPRTALTITEAAQSIGVSERTLFDWTRAYGIPTVRRGRIVLYPVDLLCEWLRDNAEVLRESLPDSTEIAG